MADTKTEKTVAEELKRAVKSLRCEEHSHPCNPPEGTMWEPGPRRHCGAPWPKDEDGVIPEALRKPLASWLEKTAEDVAKAVYEDEICDIPGGSKDHCEADCRGHDPVLVCDECGNLLAPTSPRQGSACSCWTAALATARVLNGTAS